MDFSVEGYFLCHFKISRCIDKDVANTFIVLNHRNRRVLCHVTNQSFTTTRDDQIDRPILSNEFSYYAAFTGGDRSLFRLALAKLLLLQAY